MFEHFSLCLNISVFKHRLCLNTVCVQTHICVQTQSLCSNTEMAKIRRKAHFSQNTSREAPLKIWYVVGVAKCTKIKDSDSAPFGTCFAKNRVFLFEHKKFCVWTQNLLCSNTKIFLQRIFSYRNFVFEHILSVFKHFRVCSNIFWVCLNTDCVWTQSKCV